MVCRRRNRNGGFVVLAVALVLVNGIGAHAAGPASDNVVKAAFAEVDGGPGEVYHRALTERFQKACPQIKLNFSGLSGHDAIPKIVREREAGVYMR